MKKRYFTFSILSFSLLILTQKVNAQQEVGNLFVSGPADATKLVNAYLDPLYKGLGQGLSDGWTNTAKSKGFLKFELRFSASGAIVPQSARSYDVNTLGLNNIKPAVGASSIGPTAFGNDQVGGKMEVYTSSGVPTGKFFNLPKGVGFHTVPSAQIQATLGLPKNIDVSLRAMPKINFGSDLGNLSMIGVGAKVEVLPLFMGSTEKLVPVDIALFGGFTQYNYHLDLNTDNSANSDQRIEAKFKGVNIDAIVSRKITFFTPFASVGYQTANTDLRALGTYRFETSATTSATYVDPIAVKQTDINGLKGSVGFELKFGFFKVFSAYTISKYSMFNFGLGFGTGK